MKHELVVKLASELTAATENQSTRGFTYTEWLAWKRGIKHAVEVFLAASQASEGPRPEVCENCGGRGTVTIHGGGSGDPEWDADDQPCPECQEERR